MNQLLCTYYYYNTGAYDVASRLIKVKRTQMPIGSFAFLFSLRKSFKTSSVYYQWHHDSFQHADCNRFKALKGVMLIIPLINIYEHVNLFLRLNTNNNFTRICYTYRDELYMNYELFIKPEERDFINEDELILGDYIKKSPIINPSVILFDNRYYGFYLPRDIKTIIINYVHICLGKGLPYVFKQQMNMKK